MRWWCPSGNNPMTTGVLTRRRRTRRHRLTYSLSIGRCDAKPV